MERANFNIKHEAGCQIDGQTAAVTQITRASDATHVQVMQTLLFENERWFESRYACQYPRKKKYTFSEIGNNNLYTVIW